MKNKKSLLILTSISALFLSGCELISSGDFDFFPFSSNSDKSDSSKSDSNKSDTSITDTKVARKALIVSSSPSLNYYKYDNLDLTGLHVNQVEYNSKDEILSNKEITNYSLRLKNGSSKVVNNMKLTDTGSFIVEVYKSGCESTSFTYVVNNITNFSQTLKINHLPNKVDYYIGDKLDKSGLVVELDTTYKTNQNKTFNEIITDYSISINSTSYQNYTFTTASSPTCIISYTGWDKQVLTANFQITVTKSDASPSKYVDNTIVSEDDDANCTIRVSNLTKTNDKGYYSPSEVINAYNVNQFKERDSTHDQILPSIGEVPLLVVPIVTPGDESKVTTSNKELIKKAFFGNSSDLYFESLHSYYYQSSNGKLDLTGGFTDYYYPSQDSQGDSKYASISNWVDTSTNLVSSDMAKQVSAWAKRTYNLDMKEYDSNNDGYIDGLWMVYLKEEVDSDTPFWAYKTYMSEQVADTEDPVANLYGWASLAFINDKFTNSTKYPNNDKYCTNRACDAHVLIHETGHMLGLNDYYSYAYSGYAPMGKMEMMEVNLNDHNGYSKLLLGWVNPYLVYGNCEIIIPSSQKDDAVIVINDDSNLDFTYNTTCNKYEFNCFNEYMLFELFTPKNLNKLGYDCYGVQPLTTSGVRALHVDNRLFKFKNRGDDTSLTISDDGKDAFTSSFQINNKFYLYGLVRVINNSEQGSRCESQSFSYYNIDQAYDCFDEVRWISAQSNIKLSESNKATNASLFKQGDRFTLSTYSAQFNNSKFDNGKRFSASVDVVSLNV